MTNPQELDLVADSARKRARQLIESQGISSVPTKLRRLFDTLDVERVVFEPDLGCSGVLYRGMRGWIIGLNAADRKTRQRFSCAHELAHIVVQAVSDELGVSELVQRAHGTERYIERLCDEIASIFVLPPAVVTAWDKEPVTVCRLVALAASARVSIDAAASRVVAASQQPVTFVKWRIATRPRSDVRTWRAWWTVRSTVTEIYFPPNKSAPVPLCRAFGKEKAGIVHTELAYGSRRFDVEIEFARRGLSGSASVLSIIKPVGR